MNVPGFLLTLGLLALGIVILVPVLSIGLALLAAGAFLLIWLLPILIIAASEQTTGVEKALWILAIIFLSWFAWILYFFLAPLRPRHGKRDRYRESYYPDYDQGGRYDY